MPEMCAIVWTCRPTPITSVYNTIPPCHCLTFEFRVKSGVMYGLSLTDVGVDSSKRFAFRARADRQTDRQTGTVTQLKALSTRRLLPEIRGKSRNLRYGAVSSHLPPLEVGSPRRVPITNLVHFKAVRKPLVAIIFSILNLKSACFTVERSKFSTS